MRPDAPIAQLDQSKRLLPARSQVRVLLGVLRVLSSDMPIKRGKRKAAPAIVPRFLKGAVTVGAIPALVAACGPSQRRTQPVVAYMATPAAPDEASVTPNPPVVAAYQPAPVVAAYAMDAQPVAPPLDAGVDAPTKKTKKVNPPPPPPPVVAAMMPRDAVMPKTKQ